MDLLISTKNGLQMSTIPARIEFKIEKLVNTMLDKIPTYIWESSTTTFLDPCMAGGQFCYEIERRLRSYGHSEENIAGRVFGWEANEQIIQFAVNSKRLIGKYNVVNVLNLEYNYKIMKFDVIIGNPPYNENNAGSGAAGSGRAIYHKFINLANGLLIDDGYLCYIHPTTWRNGKKSNKEFQRAQQFLFDNQILSINASYKFPGVTVFTDYYLLKKNKNRIITEFCNNDGTQYQIEIPKDICVIRSYNNKITDSIVKKVFTGSNDLMMRKAMGGLIVLDKTISGSFPFADGAKAAKQEWKYQKHPHIHQRNLKVILIDNHKFRAFIDNGQLGIGDHVHYLLANNIEEATFFCNFANSKLAKFSQKIFTDTWNDATQDVYAWNNPYPLSCILMSKNIITDDFGFYQHFNLTQEEIDYVESTVK